MRPSLSLPRQRQRKPFQACSAGAVFLAAALCRPGAAQADEAASAPAGGDVDSEARAPARVQSAPVEAPLRPVSPGAAVGGIALAVWPGFGAGHAIIGEYSDHGWKFTLGEIAGLAGFFGGLSMCKCVSVDNSGPEKGNSWGAPLALMGLGTYGVLRVLEIVDFLQLVSERNRSPGDSPATGWVAPAVYALPAGGGVALAGSF